LGQNVYAYGWRDYDPAIGRFMKIDRFAEKYHKLTPYGYAGNNPILINDVQGDSLWISFGRNNQNRALYQNGLLQNKDGSRYEGTGVRVKRDGSIKITDSFLSSAVSALSDISSAEGEAGTNVVSTLQSSDNNFTIAEGWNHFDPGEMNKPGIYMNDATYTQGINIGRGQIGGTSPSSTVGSGGIIYWNPAGQSTYITRNGEMPVNNTLALGHEMGHAFDANSGNLVKMDYHGTEVGEIRASYFENQLRQTNTFNHNKNYRSQYNDGGYNLLNSNGQPRTVPPTILWNN
jgi:Effector protein